MPTPWNEAVRVLRRDPRFGPVVKAAGPPVLRKPRESVFASLAAAIVYQQLAGAAAMTIHGRFVEALGGRVTPDTVRAADPERLRGAGLSRYPSCRNRRQRVHQFHSRRAARCSRLHEYRSHPRPFSFLVGPGLALHIREVAA